MTMRRIVPVLAPLLLALGLLVPAQAAAPGGVSGRVVAPAGVSPQGLVVQLLDLRKLRRSVSTRPAADGTFSFPGTERPELFAVLVCEAGGAPCKDDSTTIAERYVGPANAAPSLLALRSYYGTADTSAALALPAIRLTRPATVTVRVRNGAAPRRSRSIEVSGLVKRHTGNTLVFRGLAPGRHVAHAFGQQRRFKVAPGGSAVLTFGTRLATVAGRVVVNGRPRSGVPVALTGADGRPVAKKTDAQGRYSYRDLTPRRNYTLRIGQTVQGEPQFAPGTPKAFKRFTLSPGQTKRIDVTVAPRSRGWLDVVIEGTGERRAAQVRLLTTSGTPIGSTVVSDGSTRIDGLAPATYLVYARWNPSSERRVVNAWRTVTVRAGQGSTASLVPRTGPGSIIVRAEPGNRVGISAPGPAGTGELPLARYKNITRGDSTTFVNVPDGTYTVSVIDEGAGIRPEPQTVQVSGGAVSVDLTAAPREGGLHGRLVDPSTGNPWPWTGRLVRTVSCTNASIYAYGGWPVEATDLELHLTDLASGDWSCVLGGVFVDPGAPSLVTRGRQLAMRGTLRVVPGQEKVVDFPFPVTL